MYKCNANKDHRCYIYWYLHITVYNFIVLHNNMKQLTHKCKYNKKPKC